jgi:hypothetical protein
MSLFRFDTGSQADILSPAEHEAHLAKFTADFWAERARAVSHMRLPVLSGTASGGILTIDPNQHTGPESGFIWSIRRLVIWGLDPGDAVNFYFNSTHGVPVWQLTGGSPGQTFGRLELTMYGGDHLIASGTIAATGLVTVGGELIQVPQTEVWKLS